MAKAIFYDRKHNCEVSNKQICHTNVVSTFATTKDGYEIDKGEIRKVEGYYEYVIGELAYKSPDCPSHCNWDRYLMYNDLIFLRFE